jgi:hypothetical protein
MGLAADVSSAFLDNSLSPAEMSERSEQARPLFSPEATSNGEVVERNQPQAAPVTTAPAERWD